MQFVVERPFYVSGSVEASGDASLSAGEEGGAELSTRSAQDVFVTEAVDPGTYR
jgi:hypothetical protein